MLCPNSMGAMGAMEEGPWGSVGTEKAIKSNYTEEEGGADEGTTTLMPVAPASGRRSIWQSCKDRVHNYFFFVYNVYYFYY